MNKRPRDICSCAFHGDVDRMKQLVTAAGVYGERWHSPFAVDTSAAARDALSRGDGAAAASSDELGAEDELEDVLGEEEVAKLMANPRLTAVVKAYSLDPEAKKNMEDEKNNDDEAEDEEDEEEDGAELLNEEEDEAAEMDRQAQQQDIFLYRRLLAHQLHRDSVAKQLQQHGLLYTSTTPPVDMTPYGILFSCREVSAGAPATDEEGEAAADTTGDGGCIFLQSRWQPSKRSRFAGTPLHWAVLSREHEMVRFLVEHGADCTAGLKLLPSSGGSPSPTAITTTTASGAAPKEEEEDDEEGELLSTLTPTCMAAANEAHRTLAVLEGAMEAHAATCADETAFFTALEERMRHRKEAYFRRFAEARERQHREAEEAALRAAEEEEEDSGEEQSAEDGGEEEEGYRGQERGDDDAEDEEEAQP